MNRFDCTLCHNECVPLSENSLLDAERRVHIESCEVKRVSRFRWRKWDVKEKTCVHPEHWGLFPLHPESFQFEFSYHSNWRTRPPTSSSPPLLQDAVPVLECKINFGDSLVHKGLGIVHMKCADLLQSKKFKELLCVSKNELKWW